MQVNGFPQSFFPPFSVLRTQPTEESVQNARSSLTTPSDAPPAKSDLLLNSFFIVKRQTPSSDLATPLAALRILDSREFLQNRFESSQLPIVSELDQSKRFFDLRLNVLDQVRTSLRDLRSNVGELLQTGSLNTRATRSSDPDAVTAQAGPNSSLASLKVLSQQVSANRVLVSDTQSEPFQPVGIAGSFIVNGFEVQVDASDSIVEIRNKINRGEDLNGNGKLDLAEDVNGNGAVDILQAEASQFGPGVFIVEDQNGNGVLDASEDRDGNDRLDGGSDATGVVATVSEGRLVLTASGGATGAIDLTDTDGVLLELGFFELNGKGNPILKEFQIPDDKSSVESQKIDLNNLNSNPQNAVIQVDGATLTSATNLFEDVLEETDLTIKSVSDTLARIQVFLDAENAATQIGALADSFNSAIRKINDALEFSKTFKTDPDVQRVRDDLVSGTEGELDRANARNEDIEAVAASQENRKQTGIFKDAAEKRDVNETAVTSVAQKIKDGLTLPFQNGGADLFKRLSSAGIRTLEDDTLRIDAAELNRALTINTDEVTSLLNDPETGILPRLESQLDRILDASLGDLDLKQIQLEQRSNIPSELANKFQRFVENSVLNQQVQNLIAVA